MTISRISFIILGFILILTPKIFAQEDEDFCIQKMDKTTENSSRKLANFRKTVKKEKP